MSEKKKFKKFIDRIKKMTPNEIKIFERFKEWGKWDIWGDEIEPVSKIHGLKKEEK